MLADSLSKISHSSSPLKMIKEYNTSTERQGIVTILRSDFEIPKDAASLRRTLSADMSSKKWLTQHGFSAMKKIASSEGFCVSITDSSSSSSSEGEEDCEDRNEERGRGEFDFWSSIQGEKKKKIGTEKQGQFDTWSSILSQKSADVVKSLPVPYVNPIVKKTTSSLSEKSLETCTESLGSETGSDGFSSYPPSEVEDMEEEMKEERRPETFSQTFDWHEWRPKKFNHKKSTPRSFPPPLPSLSCRDGASVRMQSRRENGRLILEAVSVPSQKNFRANRQDGRLVLSFDTAPSNRNEQSIEDELNKEEEDLEESLVHSSEEVKEETEMGEENDDEKIENDSESEELEIVMENAPKLSSSVINFHRLVLMMKKPNDMNSPWPNDVVHLKIQKDQDASIAPTPLAQSLPPRPKAARIIPSPPTLAKATAASSLNAYEYYWRSKPTMKSSTTQNTISQQQTQVQPMKNSTRKLIFPNNPMGSENQQVLVLRGNRGDYLVPLSNGCKVPRRSLLLWEPYCIATT